LDKIKNIIFDYGGVIIGVDFERCIEAFRAIGFPHFDEVVYQTEADGVFEKMEKGQLDQTEFCDYIKSKSDKPLENDEIIFAWNQLILIIPHEYFLFFETIKKKYRTFLLSNTNAIHIAYIENYLNKEHQVNSIRQCFEKVYFSFELGMRKPDPLIFDHVLKENKLVPGETLFIDDSLEYIKSAQRLGMRTYHFQLGEKLNELEVLK